jgi:hypothetical protein
MTVSFAENAPLTCPACGRQFTGEVWMLVDAAERPDLVEELRGERLNLVECPHCSHHGPAGAPLLLHDGPGRRVYFAAPADAAEHEVREQAQSLLYVLVGSLPEEARLPYLGDVQVEQELGGVRRAMLRNERRRGAKTANTNSDVAHKNVAEPPTVVDPSAASAPQPFSDTVPLLDAVRALLAADSTEEFEALVAQEPRLLQPEADALLGDLADAAFGQGERDVAEALVELRQTLRDLRGLPRGEEEEEKRRKEEESNVASALSSSPLLPVSSSSGLSEAAFAAVMRAQSLAELADAVRDHPALLEPWADDEIGARVEAALDEGNDRLASAVEERRDALTGLRDELTRDTIVTEAVRALIRAGDEEDALAQAISNYPVLLTGAAHEALFRLAAEARTRGDDALAERAVEYRAMLRTVRAGLEESQ